MDNEKIKCVIWDLDNTIWDGVLLEDKRVQLKENVVDIIKELDSRGILQSISSKNVYEDAKKQLIDYDLWDYFIYPQINWNNKSESIKKIRESINVAMDTLAFVDDQEFEREEVTYYHPEVFCIDGLKIENILKMDRLIPKYITSDSKIRRKMYQSDIIRNDAENQYPSTQDEFLRTLNMNLKISHAQEEDLQRAEELTVRTHQLNSTGYVYSYEQLKRFIELDNYELFVAQLDDKYGTYGKIGLALIEKKEKVWYLNLLLMSCRVMSKGVGNVLMNFIINKAREQGVALRAQFVPTDRNRIMYITYKFSGFSEVEKDDSYIVLEADMSYERMVPDYISLTEKGGDANGIFINQRAERVSAGDY